MAGAVHSAEPLPLTLERAVAVEGLFGGNLSGLTACRGELWAISDRVDDAVFRLHEDGEVMRAEALMISLPEAPPSPLPFGMQARNWVAAKVRGNELDFEGIDCDAEGNLYLVSESRVAVLKVAPSGIAQWLPLPDQLWYQARARGLFQRFNAYTEGLAVSPDGQQIWLAAEREPRGLLTVKNTAKGWQCVAGCVLSVDAGTRLAWDGSNTAIALDYTALSYYQGALFTLERAAHQLCRRDVQSTEAKRCWSFAATLQDDLYRYDTPYGVAEALAIDAQGAWLGVDNGNKPRLSDGDPRPWLFRFTLPQGGWLAR
nr:esterase-like activity of phytase family protein [Atopomonas sediminilitoris]